MMANDAPQAVLLTLLVCTLGRVKPLERLLHSLNAQTLKNFEVVIVDQNAEGFLDSTIQKFPALRINHLRTRPGLSHARNVGLAASSGRYIGFPDDDVWYRPSVVEEVLDIFRRNSKLNIITGRSIDPLGRGVTVTLPGEALITRENIFEAGNSNTIFIERMLAQSLNFDEGLGLGAASEFQSGEETDFLLRALGKGAAGWYFPDLTIFHDPIDNGAPLAERARRTTAYARGFGYLIRKYHYPPSYILGKIGKTALRGAWCLATGDFGGARLRLAWANGVLYGYSRGNPKLSIAVERAHAKKQ